MGPHHRQLERGVEVNQNRTGQNGRRANAWIVADHRGPTRSLNQALLQNAPSRTYVPAQPRLLDARDALLPFRGGLEDALERDVEIKPTARPVLRINGEFSRCAHAMQTSPIVPRDVIPVNLAGGAARANRRS